MKIKLRAYLSKDEFFKLPESEQREKAKTSEVYKKWYNEAMIKKASPKKADKQEVNQALGIYKPYGLRNHNTTKKLVTPNDYDINMLHTYQESSPSEQNEIMRDWKRKSSQSEIDRAIIYDAMNPNDKRLIQTIEDTIKNAKRSDYEKIDKYISSFSNRLGVFEQELKKALKIKLKK